jgi:hypothetical protein
MRALGFENTKKADVRRLMADVDAAGSGLLDFQQFCDLMAVQLVRDEGRGGNVQKRRASKGPCYSASLRTARRPVEPRRRTAILGRRRPRFLRSLTPRAAAASASGERLILQKVPQNRHCGPPTFGLSRP